METLVERLSDSVHQAWIAEKLKQGFVDHPFTRDPSGYGLAVTCDVCGERRSDKHHTDMLPYSELPEHIKEYDRVTVRAVLAGIEAEGLQLVER